MNAQLLNALACPICKKKLLYSVSLNELICQVDHLAYPIKEGIPIMMSHQARCLSLDDYETLQTLKE